MNLYNHTLALIKKDLTLEWRNKYAISGILMYMVSIILIIFFSFEQLQGPTWVVLFWMIILFTAINAVAKSFLSESAQLTFYYFTIASAQSVIISKIIYNIFVMLFLSTIALIFYSAAAGFPIIDQSSFFISLLLGSMSFAIIFSMMSAISSKANNSGTLMAILSFPILIPLFKILIRISLNAVTMNDLAVNLQDILYLIALNILILVVAIILFPYLWRD